MMRYLMCRPDFFGVEYVINPWMDGNVGRARAEEARRQWEGLHALVSARAEVSLIAPASGLPDMPFTANGGLVAGDIFVPSRFFYAQREPEVDHHRAWFRSAGFRVEELRSGAAFEGEGDALFQPGQRLLWAGYGVRSALETHRDLTDIFQVEVVSLRLVDQRFYHLDTCFAPLPGGKVFYFPPAFDDPSVETIRNRVAPEDRYEVGEEDALNFACNAVVAGDAVIMNYASAALRERLNRWGFEVLTTPLTEFMLAGGAAKCLSLKLEQDLPPPAAGAPPVQSPVRECTLELSGHLLSTGLMNEALDVVTDSGGSFSIEKFEPGARRDMVSVVRLRVFAPSEARLADLTRRLVDRGAVVAEDERDAELVEADADGVLPEDFYSTTIYPTEVRLGGRWVEATGQRMDAALVVAPDGSVRCTLMRDVRRGDRVVCGVAGIRIRARRPRVSHDDFGFMVSGVSSERRVEVAVEQLAWEMRRIRARGGRIVAVAGPVVIHTGGGPYLARLIRGGWIQALLGGNALAAHDIEHALYGTSLGVDLRRGESVAEGHRNHLKAINLVRRCGSIANAVGSGLVTQGIMYECIKRSVPFALAGSIRDDGPLPDTIMDLVVAQREYARLLEGADLVLMLSTMLHSVGAGNMIPAGVKMICVDINPATVTKLTDRGSLESTGIVTDVGLFLHLLTQRVETAA
ncbi:MAG: TIGR00300 family protein [Candidatus Sumerlaeaceae bacterium]|nr:TIGR00300 family protein [Candidatus Sumerlaeaceae bacterium]